MVFKSKLPLVCLVVLALFLISVSGSTDPELLMQCKHQCRAKQQTDKREIRECLQSCEDDYREKQERERGREGEGEGGRGDVFNPESPIERLRACEERCEQGQKGQQEMQSCRRQCRQTYDRERQEGGRGGSGDFFNRESPKERFQACEQRCEQGQKGQQEKQDCHRQCQQTYDRERQEGGRGGSGDFFNRESPKERFQACEQRCEQGRKGQQEKQSCHRQCQQTYDRERQEGGRGGGDSDVLFKPDHSPEERRHACMQQCYQGQKGQKEKEVCGQRCQQEYEREKEQERKEGRHGSGGGSTVDEEDPQKEYEKCRKQCLRESEGQYSQDRCLSRCQDRRRESEQGHGGQGGEHNHHRSGRQSEEEEEQQGEQEENPYVFEDHHFSTPIKTQHGRVRVLQKFTDRSKLLRGIENYRITILEAEPQTFIVPNHWDAEIVVFVANGRGTMSLVRSERRESFSIKRGDILRIPAGTTSYLINQDNNERLILAKLLQPVSTPGNIESFFGAGGENPESFYRAFSNEILEAALNAKSDIIQRIFGQQKQGAILKASREQIRALSHHEEGGIWPFGGESKGTINMFQQRPSHENQYGRLYEVAPEDHRQLQDLEVAVSYMNLTQGAMSGPMYTSKATKISIVVRGEGYFEMACPHMSSQSRSRQGREGGRRGSQVGYQKVSTPLREGTVVIIPAGHPFATVASNNQNLEVLCFEVNARNSQRFALAGQRNVVNQFEREAKELAFGVPAREVDEVFNSQEQEYFFRGPRQHHQGHADA